MISEVKDVMSTEIFDLNNFRPDDFENFSFVLTVIVGPKGETGGENFNIDVCTPKWLLDNQYDDVILGKGKIIVFRFDMTRILARVNSFFGGCNGKDWNEIAVKLSRIGLWEYEDYRAYSDD